MLLAWENLLHTDLKEKTDSNTLRVENFNSAFTSMGTSSRLNKKKNLVREQWLWMTY